MPGAMPAQLYGATPPTVIPHSKNSRRSRAQGSWRTMKVVGVGAAGGVTHGSF